MSLPANELAALRTWIGANMVDTCTIQKQSLTQRFGQQAMSWIDETVNLQCYISQGGKGDERQRGDHEQEIRRFLIYLPFGTTVDGSRRIKQTKSSGAPLATPRIYMITYIADRSSALDLKCECVEWPTPT